MYVLTNLIGFATSKFQTKTDPVNVCYNKVCTFCNKT